MSAGGVAGAVTARSAGMVGCRRCSSVWPRGRERCARCGQALRSRDPLALQKVAAWWIAGVIAYVPANLYPMLNSRLLFEVHESTIVGGAVELALGGAWFVAGIILLASVGIPVAKFVAIAWLANAVRRAKAEDAPTMSKRLHIYEVVEFVGRWSMIDIFVVAITAALVQLNAVVSITPGPAALAFALSVVFTMLSARAFDPRQIWDGAGDGRAPEGAGT